MSKPRIVHLEDEQLLRYADGETPPRAAAEIRSHLEACWQCRLAVSTPDKFPDPSNNMRPSSSTSLVLPPKVTNPLDENE